MSKWQQQLQQAVGDFDELCALLDLDPQQFPLPNKALRQFPLRVPRGFVARMQSGNPQDPLLLQVLPQAVEMQPTPGFVTDPLGEQDANPVPGLLHKYHGRVLLTVTGGCAINCRYCFRRHFPYEANMQGVQAALEYISQDNTITEVILSGGDPLLLKDKQLNELVQRLVRITHLKRLRIHTRLPIVIPERVNDDLMSWLTNTRLQTVVVLHCNHANEINAAVIQAAKRLRENKIMLLNQAVLLKGVNDNLDALINLHEQLFIAGIMPYYLHLLDPVAGSAHFNVDERKAQQLYQQLLSRLPGYLVPKLVREVKTAPFKVLI